MARVALILALLSCIAGMSSMTLRVAPRALAPFMCAPKKKPPKQPKVPKAKAPKQTKKQPVAMKADTVVTMQARAVEQGSWVNGKWVSKPMMEAIMNSSKEAITREEQRLRALNEECDTGNDDACDELAKKEEAKRAWLAKLDLALDVPARAAAAAAAAAAATAAADVPKQSSAAEAAPRMDGKKSKKAAAAGAKKPKAPATGVQMDAQAVEAILKTEDCNVVLTHTNADFDSLAGAVALAKLWSVERPDMPTHVVMPRGVNPLVNRFLAYHKHLLPIR